MKNKLILITPVSMMSYIVFACASISGKRQGDSGPPRPRDALKW